MLSLVRQAYYCGYKQHVISKTVSFKIIQPHHNLPHSGIIFMLKVIYI